MYYSENLEDNPEYRHVTFIGSFLLLLYLLLPFTGNGQTCCTGGAPLIGSLKVTNLDAKSFGLSLSYDYNKIEDFYQGNAKLNEDFIKRSTNTLFLQLDYSLNGKISMAFLLPYVWLTEEIDTQYETQNNLNSNLGDMIMMGQYKIIELTRTNITAGIGIKLPTGDTQSRDDDNHFILTPTLQAGTGSLDYILLIQGIQKMTFRKTLKISQSFNYRLNGNSSKFASHENYQFGHEFQSITGISDQLIVFLIA